MEYYGYVALGLVMAAAILALGLRSRPAAWALTLVTTVGMLALSVSIARTTARGDGFPVMAMLSWSVFLHVPALLAGTALLARKSAPGAAGAAGLGALALWGIAVDAFLVEPRWLETARVVVETDKLDQPLRIVVLADIQTDLIGAYEVEALRRAMAEEPDLVLLPGDYVQVEDEEAYAEQGARFREMVTEAGLGLAPLGAFAVRGNVESRAGWEEMLFAGTGIRAASEDSVTDLGPVTVTALSFASGFDARGRVAAASPGDFHIVVAHGPDFALGEVAADLMVAGHTHGGQVQLPFFGPLITFSQVPRAWADDTTRMPDGRTLVVSRGVGMERASAPRLRFLCRPQIVVIDVVPSLQEP